MADSNKDFIAESRQNWSNLSLPHDRRIELGALQRIATASELMATNYQKMQQDLNWYMSQYNQQKAEIKTLKAKLAAQKGLVTRVKNSVR